MHPRVRFVVPAATLALLALSAVPVGGSAASAGSSSLNKINHIVVIYQENHSFDNLYGSWERVNGLTHAGVTSLQQVKQNGTIFNCLLQNDVNLSTPPQPATCADTTGTGANATFSSNFPNAPFAIDSYIPPSATTCPAPGVFAPNGVPNGQGQPGGCTEDLVHRFYQEQYQLNGGLQNRYVTGSDAVGLSMGHYTTTQLPIYQYLHQAGHPSYAIADKFFQGAFGGSFLNHQWLIAAATPVFAGAAQTGPMDRHSVIDSNGMPSNSALYTAQGAVKDLNLTAECATVPAGVVAACGDYAVNTTQPWFQPYAPGTADWRRLPALTTPNIGDRLNAKGVDWAWYAGGWSNADGRVGDPGWTQASGATTCNSASASGSSYPYCPDKLFQFHHQPFNYFANYGFVGGQSSGQETALRQQHLRDEQEFLNTANGSTANCNLKSVSFVKPIGAENEHPGYTGESQGSNHLVDVIKAIEGSACAKDTLVVATYDEFGGFWDHVTSPGQGGSAGVADQWGPGTRIPALIVSPFLNSSFVVDHVSHDTTSILATIEHRFGVPSLGTRDASVRDLSSVYTAR
ncbi:MAG TPA: alkaline phosphatase family protein [Candidatus Dormibacteraeota bacterium]|nr:alkaline phosphatase family protein [Candidatus Dormibacteraeota bacterium]